MVTELGLKVLKQARLVIKEFSKIHTTIELDKDVLSGEFKVGVIPTLAPYIIPMFIGNFTKKYPDVELIISEMKTEDIIAALENDSIDSGILVTPLHHHQMIERTLFTESFHIYSSKDHPYYGKKQIDSKNLSLENIWLLNEGHCFRDQVLNVCKLKGKNKSKTSFESGNLETLINIIDKNTGYTLLPHLATLDVSSKKQISDFSSPVPSREVSLVHARMFLKERHINALEEIIIDHLPTSIKSNKRKMKVIEIF
jgi:LysR family hydrogen peroxide-inducible transcriptional activator